jgi:hypothetical protein
MVLPDRGRCLEKHQQTGETPEPTILCLRMSSWRASGSIARRGFLNVAERFAAEDGFGPATVKMFVGESDLLGGLTAEQVQTDAYMQLRAWSRALGLGR